MIIQNQQIIPMEKMNHETGITNTSKDIIKAEMIGIMSMANNIPTGANILNRIILIILNMEGYTKGSMKNQSSSGIHMEITTIQEINFIGIAMGLDIVLKMLPGWCISGIYPSVVTGSM
jgi:hypothetical protein